MVELLPPLFLKARAADRDYADPPWADPPWADPPGQIRAWQLEPASTEFHINPQPASLRVVLGVAGPTPDVRPRKSALHRMTHARQFASLRLTDISVRLSTLWPGSRWRSSERASSGWLLRRSSPLAAWGSPFSSETAWGRAPPVCSRAAFVSSGGHGSRAAWRGSRSLSGATPTI